LKILRHFLFSSNAIKAKLLRYKNSQERLLSGRRSAFMAFCSKCGTQVNEGASFCQACGAAASGAGVASAIPMGAPPVAASAGMTNNVAGLLCYILGIITGVIFLVIDPYKNNRFVRFHAFQSIFFWLACFAFWIVWSQILVGMLFSGGGLGMLGMFGLFFTLVRLAMFGCWIFLMIKAYNNEEFRLPIIGDLAAKQAGA
jgi:uncharacterized membrane protein